MGGVRFIVSGIWVFIIEVLTTLSLDRYFYIMKVKGRGGSWRPGRKRRKFGASKEDDRSSPRSQCGDHLHTLSKKYLSTTLNPSSHCKEV